MKHVWNEVIPRRTLPAKLVNSDGLAGEFSRNSGLLNSMRFCAKSAKLVSELRLRGWQRNPLNSYPGPALKLKP